MHIRKKSLWLIIVGSVVVFATATVAFSLLWYRTQLEPLDETSDKTVRIDIQSGMSGSDIAQKLKENGAIRSTLAANIYMRLNDDSGMQVGVYSVSPSWSLQEIIAHLTSGQADEVSVTFYPGAMLERANKDDDSAKYDVRTALRTAGFTDEEITIAFAAEYQSPVFTGRPADMGLEGYIYGDTYFVQAGATAEQVLQRAIDEFARVVRESSLEQRFAAQGLSLYEGIALASIVERESIGCPGQAVCEDQRQIASVFYNRLGAGMALGSDVTYHYAADIAGLARDHRLDSEYNTRIVAGLPPGPIAVPGLSALNAVADPAETDYLFFLSGDDDVTYFGRTDTEHTDNIRAHCQQKCLLP